MPPHKRKLAEADLDPAVPPPLPPSVEEAYRRKCVQLKNRTHEVEEANDAARLRLARIKRQVEKLRIERAFLLEQLTKRTSANVEDSDGSPSPPPTEQTDIFVPKLESSSTKAQDKPLRTKRGHRKASAVGDAEATQSTLGVSFDAPRSPGSEGKTQETQTNGTGKEDGLKIKSAFDIFSEEKREDVLKSLEKGGDATLDEELAKRWDELSKDTKQRYEAQFDELSSQRSQAKTTGDESEKKDDSKRKDEKTSQDEDVEMGDAATQENEDAQAND